MLPDGLRVLVVDDDPTCLHILHKMLRNCLYEVTKCSGAAAALELLRGNKEAFDIVLIDVHMPDMDGFTLLQHIGLEIDLPVVMMSADGSKSVVLKMILHGACDYLIKPVRMEALQHIWQHAVRRKKDQWKDVDIDQLGSVVDGEHLQKPSGTAEKTCKNSKNRRDEDDDDEEKDRAKKVPRISWTPDFHLRFLRAVELIGVDKAVPKKILEVMNEPTLTREKIASHLQKHRDKLKKPSVWGAFQCRDMSFETMPISPGLADHRAPCLLPPQNLDPNFPFSMPSMDSFGAGSSGNHFTRQQPNINYRPRPLLGGIPSNVGSNQPIFGPQTQSSQPDLPQQNPCVSASLPSTWTNQFPDTFPAATNPRMTTPVSTEMSQDHLASSMTTEKMIMKTTTPDSTGMSQDFIPNHAVFDMSGFQPTYDGNQCLDAVPTAFSSKNNELGNGGNPSIFDNTDFSNLLDQEDLSSFFDQFLEDGMLFDSDFNLDGILFDDLPL